MQSEESASVAPAGPFVVCENLVKIYKIAELEVVALQGLDLEVPKGELLAIVGASGSGKSTLLNILGGLDRPSAGRVSVGGVDLLKLSDRGLTRYRRQKVGFVWQQTSRNLIPYLTAEENVELPMLMAGKPPRLARAWAQELLDAVGLADRRRHRLAQLSGGQQQRVAIALSLANDPQLLLADEPTGEVDSATAHMIWETFRHLNARYGLTTIIVTHDPKIAQEVDRVVSIRDGKTSTETVRQSPGTPAPLRPATSLATVRTGERPPPREGEFEEYVVLDTAGRLQVPRDYLEQWGIGTRARLELTEDGILIKPVGAGKPAPAAQAPEVAIDEERLYAEEDLPPEAPASRRRRWRSLLGGRRRS